MNYFALLVIKIASLRFYTTLFPSVYAFVFNFVWCFNHFSFLFRSFPITRSQRSLYFAIFFHSCQYFVFVFGRSIHSFFAPCMLSHFIQGINHIISSVLRFFHLLYILQSLFAIFFTYFSFMSGFFKFSLFRHLQPSSPNADDIKNIVCEMKQRRVTHIIVGQLLEFYSVYPSSFLLFRILDAFFPHVFRVLLDSNVTHSQSGFCFCNHHP